MKKLTITLGILLFIGLLSFKTSTYKIKTVVFTSNNTTDIITNINKWSQYGYTVKFMLNQTLDISESRKFNSGSWDDVHVTKSSGNIIVVMESN